MQDPSSRRSYSRHTTARLTRLKPWGQKRWIQFSMIDWSAAGASLEGPADDVPLGPAIIEICSRGGRDDIHVACDVVWCGEGKVGLRLRGPIAH